MAKVQRKLGSGGVMRVGLVGCVKSKLDHRAPARDLYTSALFQGRRSFVERTCDRWFILSAEHGLVDPETILEPYDRTLTDVPRDGRRRWTQEVVRSLRDQLESFEGHTFELHAGQAYSGYGLIDALSAGGGRVESPTQGLQLGRQLAFYRQAARSHD